MFFASALFPATRTGMKIGVALGALAILVAGHKSHAKSLPKCNQLKRFSTLFLPNWLPFTARRRAALEDKIAACAHRSTTLL
jgi:hypothetical protein